MIFVTVLEALQNSQKKIESNFLPVKLFMRAGNENRLTNQALVSDNVSDKHNIGKIPTQVQNIITKEQHLRAWFLLSGKILKSLLTQFKANISLI